MFYLLKFLKKNYNYEITNLLIKKGFLFRSNNNNQLQKKYHDNDFESVDGLLPNLNLYVSQDDNADTTVVEEGAGKLGLTGASEESYRRKAIDLQGQITEAALLGVEAIRASAQFHPHRRRCSR